MTFRNDVVAYASVQFMVAAIMTFYSLNDIVLNRKKISKYFGEDKRAVKDRAYTVEEINKALQTADQRMKLIILLLTSTGQRIGSLSALTLGSLTKIEDYGIYKVTIYEVQTTNTILLPLGNLQMHMRTISTIDRDAANEYH